MKKNLLSKINFSLIIICILKYQLVNCGDGVGDGVT